MKEIESITIKELKEMAIRMYGGSLVKAVVDVKKKRVVVDAEMHVDEEAYLLERGSNQRNLWGINLYPDNFGQADFIEFDSMVNIRPSQNNNSRAIEDAAVQQKIRQIISQVIK